VFIDNREHGFLYEINEKSDGVLHTFMKNKCVCVFEHLFPGERIKDEKVVGNLLPNTNADNFCAVW
jgi:hypothetical protein